MKYIGIIVFLFATWSCIKEDEGHARDDIRVGDSIPAFELQNSHGDRINSVNMENKVSLLVFFSTTCVDCRQVFPEVERLYKKWEKEPSFLFLAVARGQDEQTVRSYMEEACCWFPFFSDMHQQVYALFAKTTIPRFYLIDRDKKVYWMQAGNLNGAELDVLIGRLLE